jgi:hypothetical protein
VTPVTPGAGVLDKIATATGLSKGAVTLGVVALAFMFFAKR